jgi:PsbP-like protein
MKTKIYFPPTRYLLFMIILLSSSLFPAIVNNDGKSNAIAQTTRLEPKRFLTVEKPTLGFKISYPYNWNITDNDFVISFTAPQHAALLTFSITNSTYIPKANLTLEQYSSNTINTIKSVESKKAGNFFELVESKPYLLSGQPGHEIAFLNGTNVDAIHNYKTLLVWSIVDGKIYHIRYTSQASEYSNYVQTVFYMIDSFRLL